MLRPDCSRNSDPQDSVHINTNAHILQSEKKKPQR